LSGVLFRWVKGSELLLQGFDQPLVALAGYVRKVLESEYLLKELVREADVEWGRVFDERPYFDGSAPTDPQRWGWRAAGGAGDKRRRNGTVWRLDCGRVCCRQRGCTRIWEQSRF
jgi:hypothetical protein